MVVGTNVNRGHAALSKSACSMFSERRENLNGYRLLIKWFGASLGKNIVGFDGGVGHSLAGPRHFAEIAHCQQSCPNTTSKKQCFYGGAREKGRSG